MKAHMEKDTSGLFKADFNLQHKSPNEFPLSFLKKTNEIISKTNLGTSVLFKF